VKFEIAKKGFSEAIKTITKLGDLVVGKNSVANVNVVADKASGVRLFVDQNSLIVDAKIGGTVTANGSASIPLINLTSMLDLSGERLTLSCVDKSLTYTAGRAKGRTSVNGPASDVPVIDLTAATKIPLHALLQAAGLTSKAEDKETKSDYTFYFDSTNSKVRVDIGDKSRSISVSSAAEPETTAKATVPSSYLDAISKRCEVADVLAANGQFTVRGGGITVVFPQTAQEGEDTLATIKAVEEQEDNGLLGKVTIPVASLTTAIKDATAVLSDKDNSSLEVQLLGQVLTLQSRSALGSMETSCEITENPIKGSCTFAVGPVKLLGVLKLYAAAEFVRVRVYPAMLVLERLEKTGDIETQTCLFTLDGAAIHDEDANVPVVNPDPKPAAKTPKKTPKPSEEFDDDTE
jgi:hypothetical protein